jgi:hypothetical protein
LLGYGGFGSGRVTGFGWFGYRGLTCEHCLIWLQE